MIRSFVKTVRSIGRKSAVSLVRFLPQSERNGRLFVIGDLHGEYDALMAALRGIAFDFEKDRVVFTGDLLDRGSCSAKCLDMLREPWAGSVLGNHELMLLMSIDGYGEVAGRKEDLELWLSIGGEWALEAAPQARASWRKLILESAPLYWVVERRDGKKVLICHAEPLAADLCDVINVKNRLLQVRNLKDHQALWGRRTLAIAGKENLDPQLKDQLLLPVDKAYFSVHGHTCVSTATWVTNRLFIDTGAVLANRLTLVDTDQVVPGRSEGIAAWDMTAGTIKLSTSEVLPSVIQSPCR